jgi:hypothetical protein
MTREEIRDFVDLIYSWLGGSEVNGKTTHDIHLGAARQKCEQLLAALEAEKPLAVVALCPNCYGQKTVQRPPWVAGDQPTWEGTGTPLYPCPTCNAKGYIVLSAKEGGAS